MPSRRSQTTRRADHAPPAPGFLGRVGMAFKAALRAMAFSPFGMGAYGDSFGGWFGSILGLDPSGSTLPYDYANHSGSPYTNVAVAACLRVIRDNISEPVLQVVEPDADGDETTVPDSPVTKLLRKPNPRYNGKKLLGWLMTGAEVDGNGFALKVRSGAGVPIQIWHVPTWTMMPRWDQGNPSSDIEWWEYRPGGTAAYRIEPEDVIWFKVGEPDHARFGGRLYSSPLRQAAARTLCSLNEVESFTANILRHGGVPPIVIKPIGDGLYPDPDAAERMTQDYRSLFDGERRGDPFIATGPFDVVPLGYSPEQLSLKSIPDRLEDMVCAMTGVPAMLAGLSAGGARQTFANYAEARRSFYEDKLIPAAKELAEALTESLRDDPGMFGSEDQCLGFDWDDVAALRDDQMAVATRAALLFEKGVYTRAQALRAIGDDATDDDELYVVGRGVQFLRVGEQVPPFMAVLPSTANPELPPGSGGDVAKPGDAKPGDAKPGSTPASPPAKKDAEPSEGDPVTSEATFDLAPPEGEDGDRPFSEVKAADPDVVDARALLAEAASAAGIDLGDPLTPADRRQVLHALIALAEVRLRSEAGALRAELGGDSTKALLGDAKAKVLAWKDKTAKFLRQTFMAAALALTDPLTSKDLARLDAAVAVQEGFLDGFADAVLSEDVDTDMDLFESRAGSYSSAAWSIAENVALIHAKDADKQQARRVLDDSALHCDQCPELASLGWVNINDFVEIGETSCSYKCRCQAEYQ